VLELPTLHLGELPPSIAVGFAAQAVGGALGDGLSRQIRSTFLWAKTPGTGKSVTPRNGMNWVRKLPFNQHLGIPQLEFLKVVGSASD